MTVKNVWVKDNYGNSLGYAYVKETYGGQEIDIQLNHELSELTKWWKEWQPVFTSMNPHVADALQQAKVMHAITKES
jgi:hypothetical protein